MEQAILELAAKIDEDVRRLMRAVAELQWSIVAYNATVGSLRANTSRLDAEDIRALRQEIDELRLVLSVNERELDTLPTCAEPRPPPQLSNDCRERVRQLHHHRRLVFHYLRSERDRLKTLCTQLNLF